MELQITENDCVKEYEKLSGLEKEAFFTYITGQKELTLYEIYHAMRGWGIPEKN